MMHHLNPTLVKPPVPLQLKSFPSTRALSHSYALSLSPYLSRAPLRFRPSSFLPTSAAAAAAAAAAGGCFREGSIQSRAARFLKVLSCFAWCLQSVFALFSESN